MVRKAFTIRLKPGALAEYKRQHDAIWPELVAEFQRQGIGQITIFEDDPVLFLYSEVTDEDAWDRLWHTAIHIKWAQVMKPLLEFGEGDIVESSDTREIFHVETAAAHA